jgi:hypothetical protein
MTAENAELCVNGPETQLKPDETTTLCTQRRASSHGTHTKQTWKSGEENGEQTTMVMDPGPPTLFLHTEKRTDGKFSWRQWTRQKFCTRFLMIPRQLI